MSAAVTTTVQVISTVNIKNQAVSSARPCGEKLKSIFIKDERKTLTDILSERAQTLAFIFNKTT